MSKVKKKNVIIKLVITPSPSYLPLSSVSSPPSFSLLCFMWGRGGKGEKKREGREERKEGEWKGWRGRWKREEVITNFIITFFFFTLLIPYLFALFPYLSLSNIFNLGILSAWWYLWQPLVNHHTLLLAYLWAETNHISIFYNIYIFLTFFKNM